MKDRFLHKTSLLHYIFFVCNITAIVIFVILGLIAKLGDRNYGIIILKLFSDPFLKADPYEGLFTTVTEILWCIPVTICWFSWALSERLLKVRASYLKWSAILLTCVLLDDLLRITLMGVLYLSIPKYFSYLIYGLMGGYYLYRFRRILIKTPYLLNLLALLLFLVSAVVDVIHIEGQGLPVMLDDGSKLLGLLNLTVYFWFVCSQTIGSSVSKIESIVP